MLELIDRLETIQRIKNDFCSECESGEYGCGSCEYDYCIGILNEMPTIEAEPVRHGRWENIPGMNNTVFCSECLAAANKELAMKYKGCPFCLARMDGGADNG